MNKRQPDISPEVKKLKADVARLERMVQFLINQTQVMQRQVRSLRAKTHLGGLDTAALDRRLRKGQM